MRKLLLCLWLMPVLNATAQDQTVQTPAAYSTAAVNYKRSWDVVKPETNPNNITTSSSLQQARLTTEYADGFGRVIQTVIKQGAAKTGATAVDLVQPIVYDDYGRIQRQYNIFAASSYGGNTSISDGLFKLNPFQQQNDFYSNANSPIAGQGDTYFYSKTEYEPSPLNRSVRTYGPGDNWVSGSGHGKQILYRVNTAADSVRLFTVTDVPGNYGTYATSGTYNPGQLEKTISIDESNNQTVTFTDKLNHVLLRKVQLTAASDDSTGSGHTGWLCTYYIYDTRGLLRAVIQPAGTQLLAANSWIFTTDVLNEQSFRYEYDGLKRMIIKRTPGGGDVWMVYDARNRLVLMQDANERANGQWLYMLYDALNRNTSTGLWTNSSDRAAHQAAAATSTAYPNLSGQTIAEQTHTFYDGYSWLAGVGNPLSSTLNTTYNSYLQTASNTVYPYPQAVTQSNNPKGLVTGSYTRQSSGGAYLFTVNFYDNKGRLIQVQSTNVTGGTDVFTTQYGFEGKPVMTIRKQDKAGTNAQTTILLTQYTYDDLGRMTRTEKKVSNTLVNGGAMPANWSNAIQQEYNAIGQLTKKKLGDKPGAAAGTPLGYQTYVYNIHGWLLSISKELLVTANNIDEYFAMEIGYDRNPTSAGTFLPVYNGNISGLLWKSQSDQLRRKYDYNYDNANRLIAADFNQYVSGTGTSAIFNKSNGFDFSVSNLSFDANGNIMTMRQNGLKLSGSATIDDLTYNYITNSNRLLNVIDAANDAQTKLGDFRTSTLHPVQNKTSTTTDYVYDPNGNLVKDFNKDLVTFSGGSAISYNYLNLPVNIIVKNNATSNKGTISYNYDGQGNKLGKTVTEGSLVTKTQYINGIVYENDTLQQINTEEGRIRFTPALGSAAAKFSYDYFLKDYLGNVRVVLTEEQQQDIYPAATLEGLSSNSSDAVYVEKQYYTINDANIVAKSVAVGISDYQNNNGNPPYNTNPNGNTMANSAKLYRLNASGGVGTTGLGITLKVMCGDTINIFGKSYYSQSNSAGTNYPIPVLDLLTALLGAPTGAALGKGATASDLNNVPLINSGINSYLTNAGRGSGTIPKAYINWVLLDDNFRYITGNFSRVGAAGTVKDHYSDAALQNILISRNGYLYVYVSNESPVDVFFDNLQVVHSRGHVLEENHYYPYGLLMSGISSSAVKGALYVPNKIKYNGKELQQKEFSDGTGLQLYDYGARMQDPQLGRWWVVDPMADKYAPSSPYTYANDNPAFFIDKGGREIRAYDQESQALLLRSLTQLFGDNNGFSFSKRGVLQYEQKKDENSKKYTDDQKDLLSAVREEVDNTEYVLNFREQQWGDKATTVQYLEKRDFDLDESNKIQYGPDCKAKMKDVETVVYTATVTFEKEGESGGGRFLEMKNPSSKYANVIIYSDIANSRQFKSNVDGQLTKASTAATVIHELVDHGLVFIRTGSSESTQGPDVKNVYYQNKALKIIGSPQRTEHTHE
jgi:RHS repeat-associated protein